MPTDMILSKRTELEEIAWSTFFIFTYNVKRTIGKTKNAAEMWTKLQAKYVTKIIFK